MNAIPAKKNTVATEKASASDRPWSMNASCDLDTISTNVMYSITPEATPVPAASTDLVASTTRQLQNTEAAPTEVARPDTKTTTNATGASRSTSRSSELIATGPAPRLGR